jgi:hypothetical protein
VLQADAAAATLEAIVRFVGADSATARVEVFARVAWVLELVAAEIELVVAASRQVLVMVQVVTSLVVVDLAATPCVPVAVEVTTALVAVVEQVSVVGTAVEEASAVVVVAEAVAEVVGKRTSRWINSYEYKIGLLEFVENFRARFRHRRSWISRLLLTRSFRKKIRYSFEDGLEAKRIQFSKRGG